MLTGLSTCLALVFTVIWVELTDVHFHKVVPILEDWSPSTMVFFWLFFSTVAIAYLHWSIGILAGWVLLNRLAVLVAPDSRGLATIHIVLLVAHTGIGTVLVNLHDARISRKTVCENIGAVPSSCGWFAPRKAVCFTAELRRRAELAKKCRRKCLSNTTGQSLAEFADKMNE